MKLTSNKTLAFITASTQHGSMLVNRFDFHLTEQGAYGVGFQLLNASCFDAEEVDIAKQLLNSRRQHFGDGVVALDCGANLGVHTLEWANLMTGWGSVIAIEAQERIFYALAGNIAMNNCFNARAIWAAVGETVGTIEVPVPNYLKPASFGSLEIKKNASNEFIGQEINYDHTQETSLLTIDSLNLERLDFLKIDIEGMEVEALAGGRASIEKFKPQLLIEKIKSNKQALIGFLTQRGYQIHPLGINLLAIHETDPVSAQIKQAA